MVHSYSKTFLHTNIKDVLPIIELLPVIIVYSEHNHEQFYNNEFEEMYPYTFYSSNKMYSKGFLDTGHKDSRNNQITSGSLLPHILS